MARTDSSTSKAPTPHPLTPAGIADVLLESLPVGVVIFDTQLKELVRNRAAQAHLATRESVADALAAVTRDESRPDWPAQFRKVLDSGRPARFENITCRTGLTDPGFLNVAVSPLFDEHTQSVIGGILVTEDVTAQMSIERRLAVAEPMAALGKLASRVAHELNNPLDGSLRYINLALRAIETPDRARGENYLRECRKGLLRMAEIVGDLLEFSRSAHAHCGTGNINSLIEDALSSFQEQTRERGVTVACSLHERAPTLPGQNLYQVFCNLVKNALDAMPRGGVLSVTTELDERYVSIRFEDTGTGLLSDPERIFEPFFTTKPHGRGTGLGLAICREIIERYHGRIHAANREGGGAVFQIQIPLDCGVEADRHQAVAGAN